MKLSVLTLLTLLCVGVRSAYPASENSRHWGPARPVVSEYTTYSESQVKVYKDDQLISSTQTGAGGHYSHITAIIRAFRQTFVLRLVKNRYLFASSYVERVITENGWEYRQTNNTNADHCYYIGSVDGYSSSTASACTCYGFLGEFTVGNETYSVEPVDETLTGRHRVYKESDSIQPAHSCGNTAEMRPNRNVLRTNVRKKRALTWPQDLDTETRVVEFYVVNDYAQYVNMGRDISTTITRTKTIVNAASALYHPESVYVVLVGIEVWTTGDMITINATQKLKALNEFTFYRQNDINPYHNNDNAQLLTGVLFDNNAIGLAWTYTMCNYTYSCAFTADYHTLPAATAAVMAHEMGHNFGFDHDDEIGPCDCDDPVGRCIMWSSASDPPSTRWSQCSKDRLEQSFNEQLDYCLHNIPQTIYDDIPDCGNGIIDKGEECDCGSAPASQCNPACCSNCRLTTTASCAYGRCCDVPTCQLRPAYTECRAAKGQCDLPEYCSGTDPVCPSDVHRRNTDSCTVNAVSAYCYNGECSSHQSQCRLWWGDDADNAGDDCYTTNNARGQLGGNCGYNFASDTYKACSASDVLCGSLQCDTSAITVLQSVTFPIRFYRVIKNNPCTSAVYRTFYNGPDRPDPGFVPDGAACGTGKMCLQQQCVDVSTINAPDCGSCSMHGVCNSLGQCHCDIGFAPPDCSQPGGGGSYHSNAASEYPIPTTTPAATDSTDNLPLILGIVGGAVAAILIAVVIGVIIWRVKSSNSAPSTRSALPTTVSASPVTVYSKPSGLTRFSSSQLCIHDDSCNNGYYDNEGSGRNHHQYAGCYNNGYHDNPYAMRNYHPCYKSRIDVQSNQFLPL